MDQLQDIVTNHEFFRLWKNLPREDGKIIPYKSSLNPMVFRKFLPRVYIFKKTEDGQLVAHLTGTEIDEIWGIQLKSEDFFSLADKRKAEIVQNFYDEFFTRPTIAVSNEILKTTRGYKLMCRTIHLPLLDKNGEITFKFGYMEISKPNKTLVGELMLADTVIPDNIELESAPIAEFV